MNALQAEQAASEPGPVETQWPRWEVFKQDTPTKPHQAVGSVHATDPAHALVTARSVFVRRPSAVSLWVAPADAILSRTAQELDAAPPAPAEDGSPSTYLVFRKTTNKRSMTFVDFVGDVQATSPHAALDVARTRFTDAPALTWWIVPDSAVTRSDDDPDTIESWFAPAKDKTYRQQSSYGVVGSHVSRHKVGRVNE